MNGMNNHPYWLLVVLSYAWFNQVLYCVTIAVNISLPKLHPNMPPQVVVHCPALRTRNLSGLHLHVLYRHHYHTPVHGNIEVTPFHFGTSGRHSVLTNYCIQFIKTSCALMTPSTVFTEPTLLPCILPSQFTLLLDLHCPVPFLVPGAGAATVLVVFHWPM